MTATERLRELLDERGVEYTTEDVESVKMTYWLYMDELMMVFAEYGEYSSGTTRFEMHRWCFTPEQAVEATLGREECRTVAMDCFGDPPYNKSGLNGNSTACGCSECGAPWSTCGLFRGNQLKHNFKACPICGRKVVDECHNQI